MANYGDAFDEGEDFTAEDLEEFLSPIFLWAATRGGSKYAPIIAGVMKLELRSGTELTPALHFSNFTRWLPLNKTHLRTLKAELGDPPVWVGAVIGIHADRAVIVHGKPALRLKVLKAPEPGTDCRSIWDLD
jgi:hypothetical protein